MKDVMQIECETDVGKVTIKDYMKALLVELWTEEEGFSGKRPFGNSGWSYSIYSELVRNGLVEGKLDEDGYVEEMDTIQARNVLIDAINKL